MIIAYCYKYSAIKSILICIYLILYCTKVEKYSTNYSFYLEIYIFISHQTPSPYLIYILPDHDHHPYPIRNMLGILASTCKQTNRCINSN